MDFFLSAYFRRMIDFGPVVMEPRYLIPIPSGAEILAEANDLWYDVVEHPIAIGRLSDDGCPITEPAP